MENKLSMISVLFEGKKETKEQATALKKGLTMADNLAAYAKIFNVDAKVAARAISKDVSVLEKQISTISRRIVKKSDPNALKSFTKQIPDELKLASKELAMKRLWESTQQGNKSLTKAQVETIINSTKSETKILWNEAKSASAAAGKGAASGGKNTKGATSGGKNTKGATSGGKNTKGTTKTNVDPKVVATRLESIKQAASTPIKVVKGLGGFILKSGKRLLAWKLIKYGIIAWVGYELVQYLIGLDGEYSVDDVDTDKATDDWKRCIVDAFTDNGEVGIYEQHQEGDDKEFYVLVNINEFGGKETGGWIKFYNNYEVETKSGDTGKWECNQDAIKELNEQSEGTELTARQIQDVIDVIDDNLSGDFFESDDTDMKDALDALKGVVGKTYKDKDAVKVVVVNYERQVGKKLSDHVANLTNLKFTGLEYRDEFLSIIGSAPKDTEGTQSDKDGDGGPLKSVSHITIVWDEEGSEGGSGGTVSYKPCDSFPMTLGCISDKIKDIQRCMNPTANLKVDGYFGPLTLKAMLDNSYFADNSKDDSTITKEVYDTVMKKCSQKDGGDSGNTVEPKTKEREKVEPVTKLKSKGLTIIPIPKLDSKGMIDTHGIEKLLDQAKKTIDGQRIQTIINDKIKFRGGRYILNMDEELTSDQLIAINRYMAGKGFSLDKKKETLKDNKYVWTAEDRKSRRIARKEKQIQNLRNK